MNAPNFTVLGGGPTVLMLHGIGGGHLAFAPQVETLATAGRAGSSIPREPELHDGRMGSSPAE